MRIVATAGHVDHGKSTLVRALTGMEPDRWEEERRRGLTIDLGFAWTTLPGGAEVSFVDVPGHVRFLANMLAGVGAVDACLFVVSATEGWMPQSEEHLRILELLGLSGGVVALTHVDLADDETVELARLELADHLSASPLAGAEVVEVAVPADRGVDELAGALARLVGATPAPPDHDRPRLWVDRSFSLRGAGTVVTGTLTGGALAVDDDVAVEPAGRRGRIRALHSCGRAQTRIGPGHRAAINLAGVSHHDVARGHAVVSPGRWHLTRTADASLRVLGRVEHPVTRRGAWSVHIGTAAVAARVRILGPEAIEAGQDGLVRLHLPAALPLVPGDRFVLREWGRAETVGGGEILDVDPQLRASRARPDRSVERVVAERGLVEPDELERLTGQRLEPTLGRWVADPAVLAGRVEALEARLDGAGPLGLDVAALDDADRAVLGRLEGVVVEAGRARRGADPLGAHPYPAALAQRPFDPPAPDGVEPAELRELVRRGAVIERNGLHLASGAVDEAARTVAGLLALRPEGVTVSQVREALGTTRRVALPLLAELDARGVTRRRGDVRIAGPRLPSP